MQRKGDVSEVLMTIFGLVISILILSLLVPKMGEPSMKDYGDKQAYITAKILASSINSLSSMEQGEIMKTLELKWDVHIECEGENKCYVRISHQDYRSTDIGNADLLGGVKEAHLYDMTKVRIFKNINEPVRVEKI